MIEPGGNIKVSIGVKLDMDTAYGEHGTTPDKNQFVIYPAANEFDSDINRSRAELSLLLRVQ
jgi:hypothetical protein